jgi:hypothetical protein
VTDRVKNGAELGVVIRSPVSYYFPGLMVPRLARKGMSTLIQGPVKHADSAVVPPPPDVAERWA